MRVRSWQLTLLLGFILVVAHSAKAQTATYHLHKEASSTSGLDQLKTAGPDAASVALQTANLKNAATGAKLIKEFDTQAGDPNASGVIPSGSTLTFNLWMKKTASLGTMFPQATVKLNNSSGTLFCTSTGSTALTTTLTNYAISCNTSANITMTTSSRFYLWVGVSLTVGSNSGTFAGELDIEGTLNGNYDSQITLPTPTGPPTISSLTPNTGAVGSSIVIAGTNFRSYQISSTIKFNGTTSTPTSWSGTSITAPVPAGAATGSVVVTVGGQASSGVTFTVTPAPSITSLSPSSGAVGALITVNGMNFGPSQGNGNVKFNGNTATIGTWGSSSITATAPAGTTTGNVVVTAAGGVTSAGSNFTVVPAPSITSLSASSGAVGAPVTITGANFGSSQGSGTVKFNGTTAIASPWTTTGIGTTVPAGATTGNVVVNASGVDSNGVNFTVTAAPTINSLTPNSAAIGTSVAIAGNNFGTNGTVSFNGTNAATANWSSTSISAVVPPGSTSGNVVVTTGGFSSNGVSFSVVSGGISYVYDDLGRLVGTIAADGQAATYAYDAVGNLLSIGRYGATQVAIINFAPIRGPAGASVTINGSNFSSTAGQNGVQFSGTSATVNSATSTQLVVTVPSGATTGPIQITTPVGTATTSTSFTVTSGNSATPTITSFTPNIGIAGDAFAVTGTNFETIPTNDKLKVYRTPATVSSASSTSLSTAVPSGATSGHLVLQTPNGVVTSSGDFFVPPAPYVGTDVLTATRASIGGSAQISVGSANKIGLVVFDGTASQRVSFKLTNLTFAQCNISVLNPDGSTLVTPQSCLTGDPTYGFVAPVALPFTGTYQVMLESKNWAGSLTLNVYNVVDNQYTWTTGSNSALVATTDTPGQQAFVQFSGVAGQQKSWNLSSFTISACTVTIRNPDGSTFYSGFFNTSGGYIDTQTMQQTGTYVMGFSPISGVTGTASLMIYEDPDITGTITPGGASVTANLATPGQNARYTFSGTPGQKVSLNMTNITTYPQILVSILKPDGSTVYSGTFGSAYSTNFLDTQILPVGGTYTILLSHHGTSTGSLTLTLYNDPDVTGPIAIDGTTVNVNLQIPGQDARYTFMETAGHRVSLTIGNANITEAFINIVKPDGTTLTSKAVGTTLGVSGAFISPQLLSVDGSYTVWVQHVYNYTGTLTLNLYDVPPDITGTIVPNGPPVTVTITGPGQQANLTFSETANNYISLNITNDSISSALATVIKPDSSSLTTLYFGTGGGFIDATLLPSTGTYTLSMQPQQGYTGGVTLTLYDATPVTSTITPGGTAVTLSTSIPGQNGKLTFSGTAGQLISLGLYPTTVSNSNVIIYKPDGSTLASSYYIGSGGSYIDRVSLPNTGIYTIFWDPAG